MEFLAYRLLHTSDLQRQMFNGIDQFYHAVQICAHGFLSDREVSLPHGWLDFSSFFASNSEMNIDV